MYIFTSLQYFRYTRTQPSSARVCAASKNAGKTAQDADEWIRDLNYSADGARLAVASNDCKVIELPPAARPQEHPQYDNQLC